MTGLTRAVDAYWGWVTYALLKGWEIVDFDEFLYYYEEGMKECFL